MAFLFGRNRQRSAQDLVKSTKEVLQRLVKEDSQNQKASLSTVHLMVVETRCADVQRRLRRKSLATYP